MTELIQLALKISKQLDKALKNPALVPVPAKKK